MKTAELAQIRPRLPQHPETVDERTAVTTVTAALRQATSRFSSIPTRSVATIGRGAALAVAVLRYAVIDTVTLKLPVGEFLMQAWSLLKVTALPAILMAIPFGAMVSV